MNRQQRVASLIQRRQSIASITEYSTNVLSRLRELLEQADHLRWQMQPSYLREPSAIA